MVIKIEYYELLKWEVIYIGRTYVSSLQKGFVFLKNGLFVRGKTKRPFFPKGCSFIKNGLCVSVKCVFIYQTAVIFLPEACDFSNGQL